MIEMKTALVVNCSARTGNFYNLGARRLADWLRETGIETTYVDGDIGMFTQGYDLVCLSVVFSWQALIARDIALRVKANSEVWCGGPGMTRLKRWWLQETGLLCHIGLDQRFERQRGKYLHTFASRGCPVGCGFCIVPKLEGLTFTLDPDFSLAPVLCDNNLSALPNEYQDHIIHRYKTANFRLVDANSGFEPKTFTQETYERWKPMRFSTWRFAFDEWKEAREVQNMMEILKSESAVKKQVYVLAGNEPFAECLERANQVIAWGGEPYVQFLKPLDWLGGEIPVNYDWTPQKARDFQRYFNRRVWKSAPITEYEPRKHQRPFAVKGG
jgi:hypothetical protein